jgi:hypothetical protein
MEYWGVRKRQPQKESGARIQKPGGAGGSWPIRVFSTQRAVGRRFRWGEDLGAPKTSFFQTFLRAGFEPRRGRPTSLHFESSDTEDTLDEATRTHGSNPARNAHFQMDHPRRAEIFALPHPGLTTNPLQVQPNPCPSWLLDSGS